jgi:hypothetical protein
VRVHSNVIYKPIEIEKIRKLICCGLSANQVARETGCSASAIYNAVKCSGDADLEMYLRANGKRRQSKPLRTRSSLYFLTSK